MIKFFKFVALLIRTVVVLSLCFGTIMMAKHYVFTPFIIKYIGPFSIERHLYIDNSFSEDDVLTIIDGATQWEKKTNGLVKFEIHLMMTSADYLVLDDSKAIAITKMRAGDDFLDYVDAKMGIVLGLHTKRFQHEIIVIVPDRMDDELEYRSTVMHELGHALGLDHRNSIFTLMYPSSDFGAYTITYEDLSQFCEIYYCDPKKLINQ